MISVDLAGRLHRAGVRWDPADGDRFVVPNRAFDGEVFTIASMVVDVTGSKDRQLVRFNGTVEWALDAIERDEVVWLPAEDQLRTLLGATFRALSAIDGGYRVDLEVAGVARSAWAVEPAESYGLALLTLATGEPVPTGSDTG